MNGKGKFQIEEVRGREILDCRGEPTLEVEVKIAGGALGRADVPCGRSKGKHEASELRDEDDRYNGKGVLKSIKKLQEVIAPKLVGEDAANQRGIDELLIELDGTDNKSQLGANTMVGVSLAVAKATAGELDVPLYKYIGGADAHILPVPVLDLIEGGILAATDLDFQEHQAIPVGVESFSEAIRVGMEVYYELGQILKERWGKQSLNVGVEGGYTPTGMKDPKEALDAILEAIANLGYEDIFVLSLDCAATHFYDEQNSRYTFMGKKLSREELIDYYEDLVASYPIVSIEDPLEEDDYEGFSELTKKLDIQIIGDDLFVTNPERIQKGIKMEAANALLLKVNQIGTLTEALDAAQLAFRNGYGVQVSERSGQTEDTWLADLAVAINAGQIKTGVTRSERTSKYNQLIRIEEFDSSVQYAGKDFRHPFK